MPQVASAQSPALPKAPPKALEGKVLPGIFSPIGLGPDQRSGHCKKPLVHFRMDKDDSDSEDESNGWRSAHEERHLDTVETTCQAVAPPPERLPPGWKAVWDEARSQFYYWQAFTQRTAWECPVPEAAPPQQHSAAQLPAEVQPVWAQQQPPVQGTAPSPVQPATQPREVDELPLGWQSRWDTASQRHYYYQVDVCGHPVKDEHAQWEPPTRPQQVPSQPQQWQLACSPFSQEPYDPWACPPTPAIVAEVAPAPCAAPSGALLPAGQEKRLWRRVWSQEHKLPYWYNQLGQAKWSVPECGACEF